MSSNAKLFSGTGSQYLSEAIAKKFGEPLGKVNIQRFSDGEIGVEFQESIRGQFVFLIQSTFSPTDNLMELLLMVILGLMKKQLPEKVSLLKRKKATKLLELQ